MIDLRSSLTTYTTFHKIIVVIQIDEYKEMIIIIMSKRRGGGGETFLSHIVVIGISNIKKIFFIKKIYSTYLSPIYEKKMFKYCTVYAYPLCKMMVIV